MVAHIPQRPRVGRLNRLPDPPGDFSPLTGQARLPYWDCSGRLDDAIAAVEPNGGKMLEPKHPNGPYGFRAAVLGSEGNRIALHSS